MMRESIENDLYEQIAKASGVEPESVKKVLEQLGFLHVVKNLQGVGDTESLRRVSAKQLSVEIMLDKAILVK